MTERSGLQQGFLASCGLGDAAVTPLASDASFRRYARVAGRDGGFILMDAPHDCEDVRPFVAIARHLQGLGYSAPEVFSVDAENGFLLLEDLGEATYARMLADAEMEEPLYSLAVDLLINLHRHPLEIAVPEKLPAYTNARFLEEAMLLVDWYLPAMTGDMPSPETRAAFAALWPPLLDLARTGSETLVLRDYHVDNLLYLPDRDGVGACGLLDFQDALCGPAVYDVVSLLGDARRDVALACVERMKARYLAAFPDLDHQAFARAYAILGAQRNCKILGIFTRLFRRDGKALYLSHIPRVWRLLEENLAARELAPLRDWLDANLPPALRNAPEAKS
ncbi:MAG: aminoglycoside phosphotransferase [Rhodospirillaceae bacterium]|nr:MAG: aminoglycoside phosphotransferase [Rhodospirillaceae bacterium]